MKAKFITRCGCERTISITVPPPPALRFPLKPPRFNEGLIRPWMDNGAPLRYDPKRDGLEVREFKLSAESLDLYQRYPDTEEVWYDEVTMYDPLGYDAGKRTYAPEAAKRAAPDVEAEKGERSK